MADPGKENQATATATATWEDLPEPVIEHIQSFLPVRDAIRSCIISKSSLHVIPTSPDLIIDPVPTNRHSADQIRKHCGDFVKFIGKTMARYQQQNLPIHRFDLNLILNLEQSAIAARLLHDWLRIATSSSSSEEGLKHLAVQADCHGAVKKQVLRLRGCDFVNLSCLVTLFFRHIHFEDEKAVAKLFSNLPLLEKIRVVRCTGDALRRVRVTNVPRLRELSFSSVCNEALIVDKAPALVSLTYVETVHQNPSVLDLKAVWYGLKSLTLESSGFYRNLWAEVVSELPVLEDLSIRFCRLPPDQVIKLASVSLKILKIRQGGKEGLSIELDAPNLLRVSYKGAIVPNLCSSSNVQLKFSTSIDSLDPFYHLRWRRLGELLLKTGQSDISICMSELVKMNESFRGDLSFFRRPSVASPAKNVKNVWFTGITCEERMFPVVLDTLFSVCHPEYACMKCFDDNVPFMGFLLTKLMGKRHKSCCASDQQIKCWRHYLKKGSEIEFRSEACGEGWQPLPFHWRDLINGRVDKSEGYRIRIRLSWRDRARFN